MKIMVASNISFVLGEAVLRLLLLKKAKSFWNCSYLQEILEILRNFQTVV